MTDERTVLHDPAADPLGAVNLDARRITFGRKDRGNVRGIVGSLTKVIAALELAGIELIGEGSVSTAAGRGVRLKSPPPRH